MLSSFIHFSVYEKGAPSIYLVTTTGRAGRIRGFAPLVGCVRADGAHTGREEEKKKHLKKKPLLIIKNGFSKYLLLALVFFLFVCFLFTTRYLMRVCAPECLSVGVLLRPCSPFTTRSAPVKLDRSRAFLRLEKEKRRPVERQAKVRVRGAFSARHFFFFSLLFFSYRLSIQQTRSLLLPPPTLYYTVHPHQARTATLSSTLVCRSNNTNREFWRIECEHKALFFFFLVVCLFSLSLLGARASSFFFFSV